MTIFPFWVLKTVKWNSLGWHRFFMILFLRLLLRLVSIEKIYETLKTMFDYIFKVLKVSQNFQVWKSRWSNMVFRRSLKHIT